MQPGHNLHPTIQSPHHPQYCPGMARSPSSSTPSYSRTPSPSITPSTPIPSNLLDPRIPTVFPPPVNDLRIYQLMASWPMNGPQMPSNVYGYLSNPQAKPEPDYRALFAQAQQISQDAKQGLYDLPNPDIAPHTMISRTTEFARFNLDEVPWTKAGPGVQPIPEPAELPGAPGLPEGFTHGDLYAYNGLRM